MTPATPKSPETGHIAPLAPFVPTLPRTKCPLCRGCGEVKIAVQSDPMRLASCPECHGGGTVVDRRLIQAAPDLLAACEAALPWLDLLGNYIGNGVEADPTKCGVPVGPMGRCNARLAVWTAIHQAKGGT